MLGGIDQLNDTTYICSIAALAGFTQGLSGFGSIIVSIPLLALFLNIKTVIPFANILALFLSVSLFIQLRRHFQWREVLPLLLPSLPGISAGVYILKIIDGRLLEVTIGLVLVGFSLYYLFGECTQLAGERSLGLDCGLFSGCLGGSIGITGPPVIIYTSLQLRDKDTTKSTLVAYFFAVGISISAFHAASGLITIEMLKLSAMALPALALGAFLGAACYAKIGMESYKRVITLLILVLGIITLWRALG